MLLYCYCFSARKASVVSNPPVVPAEIQRFPSIKSLASKEKYHDLTAQLLDTVELSGALFFENADNDLTNVYNGWTKFYNVLFPEGEASVFQCIRLATPSQLKRKMLDLLKELRDNPDAPRDFHDNASFLLNSYEALVQSNKEQREAETLKAQDQQRKMRAIEVAVGAIPSGCTKARTPVTHKNCTEWLEAGLGTEGVNLLGMECEILSEYDRAARLRGKDGGGKAQHSTSLRLGEKPAAICSVESYSKMKSGTNKKKAITKRGGDQVVDLTEAESSVKEGATKKCKRRDDLPSSANNELIDLTGAMNSLAKTAGELEHERETQLTAAIESSMTKFVPAILAAFSAMQKMQQQPDSVPPKKKDNKDNGDDDDDDDSK